MRYAVVRNQRPSLFCWDVIDTTNPTKRTVACGKYDDAHMIADALNAQAETKAKVA